MSRAGAMRLSCVFFFNDTAPTEIYPLSLHDALPISPTSSCLRTSTKATDELCVCSSSQDRKSTRLNSSHLGISYAVFCLKNNKDHKIEIVARLDTHLSAAPLSSAPLA